MVSELFLSTGIVEVKVEEEVEEEEGPELAGREDDSAIRSDLSVVSAVAVQYLALCNTLRALSWVTGVNLHTLNGTMALLAAVPSDTSTHRCIPPDSDPWSRFAQFTGAPMVGEATADPEGGDFAKWTNVVDGWRGTAGDTAVTGAVDPVQIGIFRILISVFWTGVGTGSTISQE
jgi:hypothetical protein